MKKILCFLPSILFGAFACFFIFNFFLSISHKPKQPRLLHIDTLSKEKKSFVVLIYAKDDVQFCERSIQSVLNQHYPHFRLVFIDDGSKDGTGGVALEVAKRFNKLEQCIFLRENLEKGFVQSIYESLQKCGDDEVVVIMTGRDLLSHDRVLDSLNKCYASKDVWITYGSHLIYPHYKKEKSIKEIPEKIKAAGKFRQYFQDHFINWHFISGYAKIFKKIEERSLKKDGNYLMAGGIMAFFLPMMELANSHSLFLRDILYIYNRSESLGKTKKEREARKYLYSSKPYSPIVQ
ncbi:MAG: glycosyltransferase family 2 protein [Chlamydiae bacterium]|nr:glycosyltransferase family 2 protein [Chlamydiota bacterium]